MCIEQIVDHIPSMRKKGKERMYLSENLKKSRRQMAKLKLKKKEEKEAK